MKYRIYKNKADTCKIQRKMWFGWQWLDATDSWCNSYGKDKPRLFRNEKSAKKFIDSLEFKILEIYPFTKHIPTKKGCNSPEHNPPTHIVLPAGTHTYQCPTCGESQTFTVDEITMSTLT